MVLDRFFGEASYMVIDFSLILKKNICTTFIDSGLIS